jgi:succinate dehydrogenase/fumarate reductase cytochrome b subunit
MVILFIILTIASVIEVIKAFEEYQKPLPSWYKIKNPSWYGFFRIIHSISRFILTIFWIFWWMIIIGMIAFGKSDSKVK